MAKYFYNKYNVTSTKNYYLVNSGSSYISRESYEDAGKVTSYTIDSNGKVWPAGSATGGDGYSHSGGGTYTHYYSYMAGQPTSTRYKLTRYDVSYNYSYTQGSLIQSNIIAEDGTYPVNGQQGGYWYVRGSAVPLPSVPTSLTVPTPLKSGEAISISWSASTNATSYQLERSLNGGTYVGVYSGANRAYVDTVPKGSLTVQYRVKATGTGGTSAYKTGSLITVINFPEIYENFNGVNIAYEAGWENVGGVWVEIDSIWENVNGAWVEL